MSPSTDLGPFLHAIADPARRRILEVLKEKRPDHEKGNGLNAGEIESRLKLAQPTISHHMKILQKAGLVEVTKQGHWRWYRRNQKTIAELIREFKSQI